MLGIELQVRPGFGIGLRGRARDRGRCPCRNGQRPPYTLHPGPAADLLGPLARGRSLRRNVLVLCTPSVSSPARRHGGRRVANARPWDSHPASVGGPPRRKRHAHCIAPSPRTSRRFGLIEAQGTNSSGFSLTALKRYVLGT